ncbi:MAG: hypothetical protein QGF00_23115 [Planctomycetota bacterium]|nr:hypothetical protein [Planctomycetota bacterium]
MNSQRTWLPQFILSAALFFISVVWVIKAWPLSPAGQWKEIYSSDPAWFSMLYIIGPAAAALALAVANARLDRAKREYQYFCKAMPFALVAVCFWAQKSAVQLRMAGAESNHFYFAAPIGPGAFVGQAMSIGEPPVETGLRYLQTFDTNVGGQHWGGFGGTRVISNPPGATMLFYTCRKVLEAMPSLQTFYAGETLQPSASVLEKRALLAKALAQFGADVCLVLIALGMPPLYWLARELLPEEGALPMVLGAIFIPSLLVFNFTKDAYQISLALWFWLALLKAMQGHSDLWAWITGLLFFIGIQFSLSFLVVDATAGAICLLHIWRREESPLVRKKEWRVVGMSALSCLLCILMAWLVLGYKTWSAMLSAWQGHQQYHREFGAPYGTWVWLNIVHLFLFIGGPAAAALICGGWSQIQRMTKAGQSGANKSGAGQTGVSECFVGLVGIILVLNFTGMNLSEVPRLWMVFMPVLYLASERAAGIKRPAGVHVALLTMQIIQAAIFTMCFDPLGGSHRAIHGLLEGL